MKQGTLGVISYAHTCVFIFCRLIFTDKWEHMEEYACMIPRNTYEGAFYRAVLALHMNQFQLAQQVSKTMGLDLTFRHIWRSFVLSLASVATKVVFVTAVHRQSS